MRCRRSWRMRAGTSSGCRACPGCSPPAPGIELLLDVGIDRLSAHVEGLVSRCIDGLAERGADVVTPRDPAQRAGVIAVRHADPQRVFDECRRRSVDIGAIGAIRVDPHGFNTAADIDRFLDCYDAASG